eukprot:5091927-Amphidinium_carterae.1
MEATCEHLRVLAAAWMRATVRARILIAGYYLEHIAEDYRGHYCCLPGVHCCCRFPSEWCDVLDFCNW